jgi:hypothetical protein
VGFVSERCKKKGIEVVLHLRGRKGGRDHFKNICVAPGGVVESRCINQKDTTTVQIESTRGFYGVCARSQPFANAEVGPADEVNELCKSWPGRGVREPTELSGIHHRPRKKGENAL